MPEARALGAELGVEHVVCILDQNMNYLDGTFARISVGACAASSRGGGPCSSRARTGDVRRSTCRPGRAESRRLPRCRPTSSRGSTTTGSRTVRGGAEAARQAVVTTPLTRPHRRPSSSSSPNDVGSVARGQRRQAARRVRQRRGVRRPEQRDESALSPRSRSPLSAFQARFAPVYERLD